MKDKEKYLEDEQCLKCITLKKKKKMQFTQDQLSVEHALCFLSCSSKNGAEKWFSNSILINYHSLPVAIASAVEIKT